MSNVIDHSKCIPIRSIGWDKMNLFTKLFSEKRKLKFVFNLPKIVPFTTSEDESTLFIKTSGAGMGVEEEGKSCQ